MILFSWNINPYCPPVTPVTTPPSGRSSESAWLIPEVHDVALLIDDHCTLLRAEDWNPVTTKLFTTAACLNDGGEPPNAAKSEDVSSDHACGASTPLKAITVSPNFTKSQ